MALLVTSILSSVAKPDEEIVVQSVSPETVKFPFKVELLETVRL